MQTSFKTPQTKILRKKMKSGRVVFYLIDTLKNTVVDLVCPITKYTYLKDKKIIVSDGELQYTITKQNLVELKHINQKSQIEVNFTNIKYFDVV